MKDHSCPDSLHSVAQQSVETAVDGFVWLSSFANAELPDAKLRIVSVLRPEGWPLYRARVVISSNTTAAFVSLDSQDILGAFDDGAFLLAGGTSRVLDFISASSFDLLAFQRGLRVYSLRDTY